MLTEWKGAIGAYKVSPDGRRVAFTATDEDKDAEKRKKEKNDYKVIDENPHNMALYVKPIDTEEPVRAGNWWAISITSPGSIGRPTATHRLRAPPHGVSGRRTAVDIAEVEVPGGAVTDWSTARLPSRIPSIRPDGRYIAFVRGAGQRSEVEGQRIMLLTRAGGALRPNCR